MSCAITIQPAPPSQGNNRYLQPVQLGLVKGNSNPNRRATMDIRNHIIAYNCDSDEITVSPLGRLHEDHVHYRMTTGAAYAWVRSASRSTLCSFAKGEFIAAVFRDGVCPRAAYRAFMQIDQFRQAIPEDMPAIPSNPSMSNLLTLTQPENDHADHL